MKRISESPFSGKIFRQGCAVLCLVVSCLMSAFQPVSAAPVPKKILIVNSYNENAPWVQDYLRTFMLTAAQNSEIACELVHMNSSLIRTDSMYKNVADGIFERFRRKMPDYMIVIGRTAFSLRDRMQEEWGDVPMIYISQRDRILPGERCLSGQRVLDSDFIPVSDIRKKYNFTYIEVPTLYKETIDMMVRMQPGMKKLVFAADELPDNMVLDEKIKAYVAEKYPHLTYEWLVASNETRNEMQSYLVSKDLSVGLLLSSWYYARQSAFGYPMLVVGDMRLMSTISRPVFALQEAYLDYGAVGGFYPDKDDILDHCRHALNEMLAGGYEDGAVLLFGEETSQGELLAVAACRHTGEGLSGRHRVRGEVENAVGGVFMADNISSHSHAVHNRGVHHIHRVPAPEDTHDGHEGYAAEQYADMLHRGKSWHRQFGKAGKGRFYVGKL